MNIHIESAIKLDTYQQTEIEKVLKDQGSEFVYSVNPEILGGLRVTVGGKRIDLSVAGKINQVQHSLQIKL